jgi:TolB-like protein/class 3 adenylate cyclase
MERRLAAILAADVVGYSALMERDEAGTYNRLVAGRKELFEPEIARHHGRIFKLMGDGLLAEFSSVVDAVECAVMLQRGLAERNASFPESERIQVRIGVNLGEVIVEGDDRYGEGVNIATRLEQMAKAGEVYVSGKVAKEVERKLAFGFEPMGTQKVKNISEPVPVYRIKLDGALPSKSASASNRTKLNWLGAGIAAVLLAATAFFGLQRWQSWRTPVTAQASSIAVLPFVNMSDDPGQEYFADGISEDLTTDLSRLSNLFVVSRNSAFVYKGRPVDARQVGRELGVRHILEGSVRRAGDQVRINVQLIDTSTGGHQWAERYDGAYKDIFTLQDRVTRSIVDALALKLRSDEQIALGQHHTNIPEAYDAFLRGWDLYRRNTPEDFKQAVPHFTRAIELDEAYGRAHAALAMVYLRSYDQRWSGIFGVSPDATFRKAREHLMLAMRKPTSTAHQVAGNISRGRGWYEDAIKEFKAAIDLDPNDSWSFAELAYTLIWAGRPAEAQSQIETAMRLDPHYPPIFPFYLGLSQFAQERYPEAIKSLEEAIRINSDQQDARLFLAATYAISGRTREASRTIGEYNNTRVRHGGLPLVGLELKPGRPLELKLPEMTRLINGLSTLQIPFNYDDPKFKPQRLSGAEIKTLLFGHRVHGRSLRTGKEYGVQISPDGKTAISFSGHLSEAGTPRIESDRICIAEAVYEWCSMVFRNPGGSRTKENEYFLFSDGWGLPFSRVD